MRYFNEVFFNYTISHHFHFDQINRISPAINGKRYLQRYVTVRDRETRRNETESEISQQKISETRKTVMRISRDREMHKKFLVQRRGMHWRLWWYHVDLAVLHNKRYRVGERQSEEEGDEKDKGGNELSYVKRRGTHMHICRRKSSAEEERWLWW